MVFDINVLDERISSFHEYFDISDYNETVCTFFHKQVNEENSFQTNIYTK